jgi:UDPglucose 6-dehydrogenase
VIRDFYFPDFLLIGESDAQSGDMLADIYRRTCKNTPLVARMNFINAEITKLAVNTFITTKISYANMIARLCEKLPGADASVVTNALGMDSRIGPKYLRGAVSYGGPCFPRENRALAALAAQAGASSGLAEATDLFNRAQIKSLAGLVKQHHTGKKGIGILGLTYKPDTDVVEESFGLLLAKELAGANLPVVVYDPSADATRVFADYPSVLIATSARECVEQADVVVATPWPQFREVPASDWAQNGWQRPVIDCWRILGHLNGQQGIRYVHLGFGGEGERVAEMSGGTY